jgi:anti-anti-sigma factor
VCSDGQTLDFGAQNVSFDERTIRNITVLHCQGRLTFTAGAELSRRITAISRGETTNVILDLEQVSYVDSAGLGAIVDAYMQVRKRDGVMKFVNPSSRTRHMLKITGIATLVETHPTVTDAVESFRDVRVPAAGSVS